MADKTDIDAKQTGEAGADASSAAADANAASASSAAQTATGSGAEETLLDVVEKAAAASQAGQVTEGGDAAKSGSIVEPNQAAQAAASAQAKEVVGTNGKPSLGAKVDEDGKELPPFHEHPRWKEAIAERNDLRTKMTEYETKLKPLVDQQRGIVEYCQSHNIAPEQFQQGMEMMALINTNPAEALKRLQPIVQQLSAFDAEVLPKDLEDRVVNQDLPLEVAREIARERAKAKGYEFSTQMTAQRQQQMALQSRQTALLSWEQSTMRGDPDFKPKAKADEPDGKYEFVVNMFRGFAAMKPPQSPQDTITLVQQAYDAVNRTFTTRLTPRMSTGKVLTSTQGTSVTAEKEPQSMEEAVMMAAARHGLV